MTFTESGMAGTKYNILVSHNKDTTPPSIKKHAENNSTRKSCNSFGHTLEVIVFLRRPVVLNVTVKKRIFLSRTQR